jgi:nitrogen regulatory protein PII 2
MKKIVAIIRDECVEDTKTALEKIGVLGVTFLHVTGRGEQKGTIPAPASRGLPRREPGTRLLLKEPGPREDIRLAGSGEKDVEVGFLPKRMLVIVTGDREVQPIVQAIVSANQSGQHGDGKIFVCPMVSAIRVRTGEHGDDALS